MAGTNAFVPKGKTVQVGAIVTQPDAWMTIEDGSFLTIDTEELDCGLGSCSAAPKGSVPVDKQLGYDRNSDQMVSCGGNTGGTSPKPKPGTSAKPKPSTSAKPKTKLCADFNKDAIIEKGMSCESGAKYIHAEGGIEKVDSSVRSMFNTKCCGKTDSATAKPNPLCAVALTQAAPYMDLTEEQAKAMDPAKLRPLCDQLKMLNDAMLAIVIGCSPAIKDKIAMAKRMCVKEHAKCPKTCQLKTCDHWATQSDFACKTLKDNYGCDCGGCECPVDKAIKQCEEDTCHSKTCVDWQKNHGVKCTVLKQVFGCTCNGCNCKSESNKECHSPELKGDDYCDDRNNINSCNWDGGDCCHKDNKPKQFIYCDECECRDPKGNKKKRPCTLPDYRGDSHCDDANNKDSCGWDGGDCCGVKVVTTYCKECECKDDSYKGSRCIHSHLGDEFCDDANNVKACAWDKGDCCGNNHQSQFRYCERCHCRDPAVHSTAAKCGGKCGSNPHKGDQFCDDDNNNCGCDWDGGDCCGKTGNAKQYNYCFKCKCSDAKYVAPPCPVLKFKGDGICDDTNNILTCNWDGGDCCKNKSNSNEDQMKYCQECACHR